MRAALHRGFGFFCSVALILPVFAQPSFAANIYTCIDDAGRRLSADRPIPQCVDREQRVLGASGVERKRLGPVLTESEMAQRLELRRQEQAALQRQHDQRRRDAALLARYPGQSAHDLERQKALLQVEEVMTLARQKLQELDLRMQRLQQELSDYPNASNAPANLRASVLEVEKSQQDQQVVLKVQEDEKQRIHQRFDRELQRLQVLWKSQEKTSTLHQY